MDDCFSKPLIFCPTSPSFAKKGARFRVAVCKFYKEDIPNSLDFTPEMPLEDGSQEFFV